VSNDRKGGDATAAQDELTAVQGQNIGQAPDFKMATRSQNEAMVDWLGNLNSISLGPMAALAGPCLANGPRHQLSTDTID
jgi:hypothetical protein